MAISARPARPPMQSAVHALTGGAFGIGTTELAIVACGDRLPRRERLNPIPPGALMPFIRIAVRVETAAARKAAIARGVHAAMVAAIGNPRDDFFRLRSDYQPGDFLFDRGFPGVQRSDPLVVGQVTLRRGASDAMQRDLYARIAANLEQAAGIRPQDVFVSLAENDFADRSVGGGPMSMQIATQHGAGA